MEASELRHRYAFICPYCMALDSDSRARYIADTLEGAHQKQVFLLPYNIG